MVGSRASRTVRPATAPSFRLTERDLDILESLGRARFLTAPLVEQLHFPPQSGERARGFSSSCRTRLRLLWQSGYVERLWPERLGSPPVYALSPKGAAALAAHRAVPPGELAVLGRKLPTPFFLEHTLAIAHVYVAVATALAGVDGVRLACFQGEHAFQGAGRHDCLPDVADDRHKIPVVPDGLFVLERSDGRRRLVFLEVDRATMSLARAAAKVRGYEAYRTGAGPDLFQARFGYPPEFSVALVAPTHARLKRLRQAVQDELERWGWGDLDILAGRYLFHHHQDLAPATALQWYDALNRPVWLLGGSVGSEEETCP